MSKDLKKIILIASSLLALIIISLIIIISINREEPNPSDEPSEQAGSNRRQNYSHQIVALIMKTARPIIIVQMIIITKTIYQKQ